MAISRRSVVQQQKYSHLAQVDKSTSTLTMREKFRSVGIKIRNRYARFIRLLSMVAESRGY